MIRFINCVRKRDDISMDEFRRYWNSPEFEQLFEEIFMIVQPQGFTKNLTLQVSANEELREERGGGEPFDGTIEFWWDNAADLLEKYYSPKAEASRNKMLEFQEQFIDMEKGHVFFTEYDTKKLSL